MALPLPLVARCDRDLIRLRASLLNRNAADRIATANRGNDGKIGSAVAEGTHGNFNGERYRRRRQGSAYRRRPLVNWRHGDKSLEGLSHVAIGAWETR